MTKKKVNKAQQNSGKKTSSISPVSKPDIWKVYVSLTLILVVAFLVFLPSFQNHLLAWDDDRYITNNPLIRSINLADIFSQNVMGNYHPLTMLTLAIEYKFFGLNATGYHAFNLLLHLLNVILVFYFVFLLSEKTGVALVATLLFAVHPLHVESVAWAAELKDLLYTFFFLASGIFYLKYLKDFQKKFFVLALLMFLLSLLSKAMAASLPPVLILVDFLKGRKINIKVILEKLPFFVLAVIFGIVAIMAQKTVGATDRVDIFFLQRIVFACYGYMSYLFKILLPLNLSAYYPYPLTADGGIPAVYYSFVILFLAFAIAVIYSLRFSKKIFFGILFFAVTVFLVLQLLPVGGAVIADRYSYIPSIGIFYLAGEGFIFLWKKKMKLVANILLAIFTVFFFIKTFYQTKTWENDLTLWNNVISHYKNIPHAYYNRGVYLKNEKKNKEALNDFNKAIELKQNYTNAYFNRAKILMDSSRYDEALADFIKVIGLKPDYTDAYFARGIVLYNKKRYDESIRDYSKAIELKPEFADAYYSRANSLYDQKKTSEAVQDYNKAITLNPGLLLAWFNRGILFMNEKRNEEAIADFSKTIELNPGFEKAYVNRGNIFNSIGKYEEAIKDYSKAIELKNDFAEAYYNRGLAEYNSGKKEAACSDIKKASASGIQPPAEVLSKICK